MTFLLLAIAITTPQTPEAACDPHEMNGVLASPREMWSQWKSELDRRLALTLAAEHAVEEEHPPIQGRRPFAAAGAVTLAGLVLLSVAVGRRSRILAVVGALGCLAGAGMAVRVVDGDRQARARIGELRECRLRILQTRGDLEHGVLAKCLGDMAEMDEDLMVWQSRVKAAQQITLGDIEKMRSEIKPK